MKTHQIKISELFIAVVDKVIIGIRGNNSISYGRKHFLPTELECDLCIGV